MVLFIAYVMINSFALKAWINNIILSVAGGGGVT